MSKNALWPSSLAVVVIVLTACSSAPPPSPAPPPQEPVVSEPASAELPAPPPPPQPLPPEEPAEAEPPSVVVAEAWETVRRPEEAVDSVAVWPGRGARPWLLATAEATDRLLVFDAGTGEPLRDFGGSGEAPGLFRRPHGIAVADDLAFVVERDNARVQVLRLPGLSTLGFVGVGELAHPSGIALVGRGSGVYDLYVTDEFEPGAGPPDRRVHHYRVEMAADGLTSERVATFGDAAGDGALIEVETIGADPAAGHLLVAEEDATRRGLRIYGFDGRFTGRVVGGFVHQPAGVALYPCADGSGYWVVTDQGEERTLFRVLDRETFEEVGRFAGAVTANTDGVWMWNGASAEFPAGAFYAVHDGRSVSAFGWGEVVEGLGLRECE